MSRILSFPSPQNRGDIVADLRRLLTQKDPSARTAVFSFGLPGLDGYLPQGGVSLGALHDFFPAKTEDMPAAFGFITALLCRIAQAGPVLIVTSRKGLYPGRIQGHGLKAIGLDPARVIVIEAGDEVQAHWVIEEAFKSAVPVAVAALAGAMPDLKTSRRLHLAAGKARCPLLFLRPPAGGKSNAAATRWRVEAAPGRRDRFGLIARWRWQIALERCRNGRPGEWLVEWDHDTHCFRMAAAMADLALPPGAITQSIASRAD